MLKRWLATLRHAVPESLIDRSRVVRDAVERVRLRGDGVECPMCRRRFSRFSRFNGRDGARCPGCGSLERHRLLWLWLERHTDVFHRPRRVLHVAPEAHLRERLSSVHGSGYVCGDLADPEARLDVTELPFPDRSFDVAICSHVFEHVHDDDEAVRQFRRVLAPEGWAILDAPVDRRRPTTFEDPSITRPSERRVAFGQWDHVRVYGRDYTDLLERNGFTVSTPTLELSPDEIERHGLRPDEDTIYWCRPAVPGAQA